MKYKLLITTITFLITSYSFIGNVYAAKLYFSPATTNVSKGQSGQISVYVDTAGKNAFGVDGVINITGTAINITNISAAGKINSSELSKEIGASQLTFRILTIDGIISGVEQIASINYTATTNGTTSLTWVSGQNFNTSSVAEDVTGNELLSSVGNATFNVSTGTGTIQAVCGNGVVEGSEQCEYSLNNCPTGYSCTANCVCIFGATITPPVTPATQTPSYPITPYPSYGNGTITSYPSSRISITPSLLPKSAIESSDLKIFLTSSTISFIGLALFALFSLPEFNLELIGTKLKISYYSSKRKTKVDKKKDKFERGF